MKDLNILDNKNFINFLILIFSSLPISIILGNALMEINILLIIFSFIVFILSNKKLINDIKNEKLLHLLVIFWAYLILNSFFGIDFTNSIKRNFLFIKFILLIFSFKYLLSHFDILKKIIFSWTLVLLIVCVDVFFEFIFGFNILGFESSMKNERIVSFFKDELIVGSFLFAFLFIIVGSLIFDNKIKIAFLITFIVSLAIILSGERSTVIKLLFSLLIFIFFIQNNLKIKFISIFLLFLSVISLLNLDTLKVRYIDQVKRDLNFNHDSIKHNLLETKYLNQSVFSYEILKNNIFFGVGNKNYHKACINLKNTSEDKLIKKKFVHCYTHPHQVYYEFISEHGILGTLIILGIIFKLLFDKDNRPLLKENRKLILIFKIYCLSSIIPIIPTGSFFSSFQLFLFFLNYSFYQVYMFKKNQK